MNERGERVTIEIVQKQNCGFWRSKRYEEKQRGLRSKNKSKRFAMQLYCVAHKRWTPSFHMGSKVQFPFFSVHIKYINKYVISFLSLYIFLVFFPLSSHFIIYLVHFYAGFLAKGVSKTHLQTLRTMESEWMTLFHLSVRLSLEFLLKMT